MDSAHALIPQTFNSRDVGGMAAAAGGVRRGALIRSDAPSRLGSQGQTALAELGVRTMVDLREPVERDLDPPELDGLAIDIRTVPILHGELEGHRAMTLEESYFHLLEQRGDALAAAVGTLAAPGALPALVFCSAGKDRTGLVVALALDAVGADRQAIVADYACTQRAMDGPFRAVIEARAAAAGITEQELAVKLGAPPELMQRVLTWLDEHHRGAEGYLREHGLGEAELSALRAALVGPA